MAKGSAKSKKPRDRGLGRGLSALMSDMAPAAAPGDVEGPAEAVQAALSDVPVRSVPTHLLTRNPAQPRLRFDKGKLAELADSLRTRGVLQPILVRPITNGKTDRAEYQIVAGERRYQAALLAGIEDMPVIVRELSDRDVLEIGVVENVQRANLNPMEEARAYATLAEDFGRRHEEIAQAIGKSRAYVTNAIRLIKLPKPAQDHLLDGKLSAGHARAILSADDPKALTDAIVGKGLTVREAEAFAKGRANAKLRTPKSAEIRQLEVQLEEALGIRAELSETAKGKVTLKLRFANGEQAEAAIGRLLG